MKLTPFFKNEFYSFSKAERIIFPLLFATVCSISIILKDPPLILINSALSILFLLLAGKGKYYCNIFGAIGSIIYTYIAYKSKLYGTCALYVFVYIPMTISAFILWRKHLKSGTVEIKKTKLTPKGFLGFIIVGTTLSILTYFILRHYGDVHPGMDAFITIFSILGQILSVKRCFQQWYIWIFVNTLTFIMWLVLYLSGTQAIALLFTWGLYSSMSFYFFFLWKKEVK